MPLTNTVTVTDTTVLVVGVNSKGIRLPSTYAVGGAVDNTITLPGFFVSMLAGQTASLAKVSYGLGSGTSMTFTVTKNGAPITSLTNLSATTTSTSTTSGQALADGDKLGVTLSTATGTPTDLSITIFVDYSI